MLNLLHFHLHFTHIQLIYDDVLILAAYDPLDPNGNVTIKWDVVSWTPDGYVVSSTN